MKNIVIKILAVILLVWYSMSIIGFDVHTCKGSGRSFVVTFVEGLSCSDIHPEHKCETDKCSSAHHAQCTCQGDHSSCEEDKLSSDSCCSDDYQVLAITGTVPSESNRNNDECGTSHPVCLPVYAEADFAIDKRTDKHLRILHLWHSDAVNSQALLGIWRI